LPKCHVERVHGLPKKSNGRTIMPIELFFSIDVDSGGKICVKIFGSVNYFLYFSIVKSIKINQMETVKFTSTGFVLGNYWGGGSGAYKARVLSADTKEELIKKATEMLNDGSLDSGMGYESLIGALLNITTITTIMHKGKKFANKETEPVFIGDLTESQEDFLNECDFSFQ
jgi:hypothetical protein